MDSKKNNTIQALWVGIGAFSSFALSIVSAMILSRYLDKTNYGTYRQIGYVYNSILILFTAGLPRVFSYYLPRYEIIYGKDIVFKISKILFIGGVLFSLFLFLAAGIIADVLKNPELELGLKYFSIIPLFLLPTLGIEGIFSAYRKTIYVAIYNTISRLLMLVFMVIPVIVFKGGYIYSIYGWIISSVLTFFMACYLKNLPFKEVKSVKSDLKIKEIFSYSFPLFLASIGGIAMRSADEFFISRYYGVNVFAEFSNGFMELPMVSMITFSIATVLTSLFSKMVYDKKHSSHIVELWQSALIKSALIIYPLVLFFFFYAHDVMSILFSKKYSDSANYFQIGLTANFFNVIMFAPLLLSMGETKFYSRILLSFAVFAWVGDYIVVLLFHSPIVVAIFSTSRSILIALIAFNKTSKLIQVSFFDVFPVKKLLILALHSIISLFFIKYTINLLLDKTDTFFAMALLFASFSVFLILTSKFFKLDYISSINPIIIKIKHFFINLL
jgi:O-antigen/teichoic acid export membrane protein